MQTATQWKQKRAEKDSLPRDGDGRIQRESIPNDRRGRPSANHAWVQYCKQRRKGTPAERKAKEERREAQLEAARQQTAQQTAQQPIAMTTPTDQEVLDLQDLLWSQVGDFKFETDLTESEREEVKRLSKEGPRDWQRAGWINRAKFLLHKMRR